MQRVVNVIDIGSRRVSALVGEKGVNDSFNVKIFAHEDYEGYVNGAFLSMPSLKLAISEAVGKIESSTKKGFSSCFLGVPAEFAIIKTGKAQLTFNRPRVISEQIINELCAQALLNLAFSADGLVLINRAPISFLLDDGKRTTDAKGQKASTIAAELCFCFMRKNLKEELAKMLKEIGIKEVDFTCAPLAQINFLLEGEVRKNPCVLIDIGYMSTSVILAKGEGVCACLAFSLGGKHIINDLAASLDISYNEAMLLAQKLVLSVDKTDKEVYNIDTPSRSFWVNARVAHEIVKLHIDNIASHINRAINSFKEYNAGREVFLTGGALTQIKGAKDYLSKSLGRNVTVAKSRSLYLRGAFYSSILSVLNFGILISEIERRKK